MYAGDPQTVPSPTPVDASPERSGSKCPATPRQIPKSATIQTSRSFRLRTFAGFTSRRTMPPARAPHRLTRSLSAVPPPDVLEERARARVAGRGGGGGGELALRLVEEVDAIRLEEAGAQEVPHALVALGERLLERVAASGDL